MNIEIGDEFLDENGNTVAVVGFRGESVVQFMETGRPEVFVVSRKFIEKDWERK